MKYIFSRKGFDSAAGGYPSLIFPDGSLFSIPIPSSKDIYKYNELKFEYEGDSIQSILNDLTGMRLCSEKKWQQCDFSESKQFCHYDPMPIRENNFDGLALGQVSSSEGHLRNQRIGKGDTFLFYGWFKKVEKQNGSWKYVSGCIDPDIHLIWSCMTVQESVVLDTIEQQKLALDKFPFLKNHPHIANQWKIKNRIYFSESYKYFSFEPKRCLTDLKNYKGRATWRLPACFNHPNAFSFLNNFTSDDEDTIVSYRGYGQEFVLDPDKVKHDRDRGLIRNHINKLICG